MNSQYLILLLLLLLCGTGMSAQMSMPKDSPDEIQAFYTAAYELYSEDGPFLLEKIKYPISSFCESNSVTDMISCYPIIIHEYYHLFNSLVNESTDKSIRKYWISNYGEIEVPLQKVFNSRQISEILAKRFKGGIKKLDTYFIRNYEGGHDAQINGIFGILEEYSAYYHGMKSYIELHDYLEDFYPIDEEAEVWIQYFTTTSTVAAFYEFKIFLTAYLNESKASHPRQFALLMENEKLKELYTVIESEYQLLLEQYFENRSCFIEDSPGKISNGIFWVLDENDNMKRGYQLPDEYFDYLKTKLVEMDSSILEGLKL